MVREETIYTNTEVNIAVDTISSGRAYLIKALWHHKASLKNIQNGGGYNSNFEILKPRSLKPFGASGRQCFVIVAFPCMFDLFVCRRANQELTTMVALVNENDRNSSKCIQ